MHILDSNIIIAYFRTGESHHEDVEAFMKNIPGFAITDYIVAEVVTILQQKEGLSLAKSAINLLLNNKIVEILRLKDDEFYETMDFFLEQKQKISFVDASLIVIAKNRGLELVTLDKALSKIANQFTTKSR